MIELTSVPAPADPRSASLRRVGAKAVLVGPPSAPPLPFEVADSKTLVPPLLAGTVSRTALVNRLRAAGAFPLVLVVAPAGYGKTTLLSQWAARDVRPFAWVSVDEGDDDPVSLLRLVAAALDRIEPLPQSALEPLAPERRPAPAKALQRLGASIAARRSPFVLVLDGADALTHDTISAVGTLIGHIPTGSMIVLSGRVVPDLPVAALRAGGPLLELGSYELALSRREAEMLLRAATLELEDAEINELVEHTEGWAAGLYLTALAARAESDAGDTRDVVSVTGADRYLADYFRSEYLARLEPDRLTFLRRSAGARVDERPALRRRPRPERLGVGARRARAGEPVRRPARPQPQLVPLPPSLPRAAAAGARGARARAGAGAQPARGRLVRGAGRSRVDARLLARGRQQGERRPHPQLDRDARLGGGARGRGRVVARAIRRRDAPPVPGGRGRGLEDPRAARPRRPGRNVAGGRRARRCSTRRTAGRRPASRSCAPRCASTARSGCCTRSKSALAELAPEHPWHPWALVVNGTAHLLLGDQDQADRAFAGAAAVSGQPESHALALSERSLLAAGRDDDLAEGLALEARRLIEEGQLDGYATSALDFVATARALLRHGQWDEARRQLTVTQRLAPSLTHAIPWLAVQVRLELGHAHVTLRDRNGASALLGEAKDILALRPSLGVLAEKIDELEREIEAMPKAMDGGGSGLTPAELRLLPLLSTHLSFREIGEQLFVSRNTIKTQAISVYRKLGVSSRSDAIARAVELGLVEVTVGAASSGQPADVQTAVS